MSDQRLKLYGTDWCLKSAKLRNYLQSTWIDFDDFNVETDKNAEQAVRALYDGELKFPTVVYGSNFLKNPDIPVLDRFLEKHGLME